MKLFPIVFLITLILIIPKVEAIQLNPLTKGEPVKIVETDEYFVVGTSSSLRILSKGGNIIKFLNLKGLSDFVVKEDRIYITTLSQKFPNVKAYSFPSLEKIWEFSPSMLVFDENLVWQEKETKSWKIKLGKNGILVASGYTLYLLDENGKVLKNFNVSNDIWDFVEKDDNLYLATQEGYVYVLNKNFELKEKIKVCEPFQIINPISNETVRIVSRSVWQISPDLIAACEDGSIFFIENKKRIQLVQYSQIFLNTYYYRIRRETSFTDQLYENIKLLTTPEGTLAFSSTSLALIKNESEEWRIPLKALSVSFYKDRIYAIEGIEYENEVIKVLDFYGNEKNELRIKKIKGCVPDKYVSYATKEGLIIASNCEIKMISYSGKMKWYLPTQGKISYLKEKNIYLIFTDNGDDIFSLPTFYSVIALENGTIKWKYILPARLREDGYLKDIRVIKDKVILWYQNETSEEDKLIALELKTGKLFKEMRVSDRVYAGVLDEFLLNSTVLNILKTFDYSLLDEIPREVIEGRIEDAKMMYGEESVNRWLEIIEELPLPISVLSSFRDFDWNNLEYLKIPSRIWFLESCDVNNDGVEDLLISGENVIVARDGNTLKELWLIDREDWRYDLDINRNYKQNFTRDWFNENMGLICIGETNKDGKKDFFAASWKFFGLLESVGNTYKLVWSQNFSDIGWDRMRKIEDINKDGIKDVILPIWRRDMPPLIKFLSARDGEEIISISSDKFSFLSNIGDLNGDGIKENLIFFERYGAKLKLFSPNFEWTYEKVERFHEVWDKYGVSNPATIIDFNKDGVEDLVYAIAEEDGGVRLIFVDVKNDRVIKRIEIEKSRWRRDERDWMYTNEIINKDDLIIFSIPVPEWKTEREGKLCIFNLSEEKVTGFLYQETRKIIVENESIIVLGNNGEIFLLDLGKEGKYSVKTKGNSVFIESKGNYIKVYVDGKISAAGNERIEFRLPAKEYELEIALTDEDGYEKIFPHSLRIPGIPLLLILNIILSFIIVSVVVWKVFKWKWRSKQ